MQEMCPTRTAIDRRCATSEFRYVQQFVRRSVHDLSAEFDRFTEVFDGQDATTDPVAGLEHGDLVATRPHCVGSTQAGNARTDHDHPHDRPTVIFGSARRRGKVSVICRGRFGCTVGHAGSVIAPTKEPRAVRTTGAPRQ